jgi:hypothetical protein
VSEEDSVVELRLTCPSAPVGTPLYRWVLATQHHLDLSCAAPGSGGGDGAARDVVVRPYTPVACGPAQDKDGASGCLGLTLGVREPAP